MNREVGTWSAVVLSGVASALLILAGLWATTDGFAAWSSAGGGSGSSIAGDNALTEVVPTISRIRADATTITGSDGGTGIYNLTVNSAAFPTATPQGLTSVLNNDHTTSGNDITFSVVGDELRFSRGQTTSIDVNAQTVGSGEAQVPDLAGTTDQFVLEDLAQTLTNKTITGATNSIDLDALDTQGAQTDENCLTVETGGGAEIEIQSCGGAGGERNRAWDRRNTGSGQQHMAGCVECADGPSTETGDFADTIIYVPIFIGDAVDTNEIQVLVNAAGSAGEDARVGIYDSTTDPVHPGDLVIDGGAFAVDSTGIKTITITSTGLTANRLYWLALVTESSTVTFNSPGDAGSGYWSIPLGMDDFLDVFIGRTEAFTCGSGCTNSLPSSAGTTSGFSTQTGNHIPAIALVLN